MFKPDPEKPVQEKLIANERARKALKAGFDSQMAELVSEQYRLHAEIMTIRTAKHEQLQAARAAKLKPLDIKLQQLLENERKANSQRRIDEANQFHQERIRLLERRREVAAAQGAIMTRKQALELLERRAAGEIVQISPLIESYYQRQESRLRRIMQQQHLLQRNRFLLFNERAGDATTSS